MSVKISKELFLNKLNTIYPNNKVQIVEWNGYTKPMRFYCDICGKEHKINDARQLLNKKKYCQDNSLNNIKWDLVSYNERVNLIHQEKVKILEYNGLSNLVKYLCPKCGEIKSCSPARTLITKLSLCDECYGIEKNVVKQKIFKKFEESKDFQLITWRGLNRKLTEKCLKCGFIYDRYPTNVLQCFNSCPSCNNDGDKQRLDSFEVQKRIDDFFGQERYQLLDYKGQLNKHSKIKCLDCGLIFETQISTFSNSRGCPKCKRFKSKGEQKIQKYLEENNIPFETQKRFKECNNNLSSFDFCAYDKQNNMVLIEVNGIQHYKNVSHFGGLDIVKKRDQVKIDFCNKNNIPLITIPYNQLKDNDIDNFLSFLKGSTTIPEGSRE